MAEQNFDDVAAASEASPASRPRRTVPAPRGFRFTIGGMLAVTFAAAVIVASLFAFPPVVSAAIAALMAVTLPAMLVACLIYGGAGWRAFAIGMLLPSVLRLTSSLFGGGLYPNAAGSISRSSIIMAQQQAYQQLALRQGRVVVSNPRSPDQSSAFDHFTQLATMWDKLGYAYMTEESLFWGASLIAGLASLFVYLRFARGIERAERHEKVTTATPPR